MGRSFNSGSEEGEPVWGKLIQIIFIHHVDSSLHCGFENVQSMSTLLGTPVQIDCS